MIRTIIVASHTPAVTNASIGCGLSRTPNILGLTPSVSFGQPKLSRPLHDVILAVTGAIAFHGMNKASVCSNASKTQHPEAGPH